MSTRSPPTCPTTPRSYARWPQPPAARRQLQLHKDKTGVYPSDRLGLVLMHTNELTTDRQRRLRSRPCWLWVDHRWGTNVAAPSHATMNGAVAQMAIALSNDDLQ